MAVLIKLQKATLLQKSLKRNKKLFLKHFISLNLLGQFKQFFFNCSELNAPSDKITFEYHNLKTKNAAQNFTKFWKSGGSKPPPPHIFLEVDRITFFKHIFGISTNKLHKKKS